jgi:hypothetical protein
MTDIGATSSSIFLERRVLNSLSNCKIAPFEVQISKTQLISAINLGLTLVTSRSSMSNILRRPTGTDDNSAYGRPLASEISFYRALRNRAGRDFPDWRSVTRHIKVDDVMQLVAGNAI